MNTFAKIALGAVLVGAIIWGGIAVKHEIRCSDLEEDYVNGVSRLRSNVSIAPVFSEDRELGQSFEQMRELELKRMEVTLGAIYSECGTRAGQSAARKGNELLF